MQDIKQTLIDFSNAVTNRDIDNAFNVFDTDANVILAGSSKEELHKGSEAIKKFLANFFSYPFSVSWDLSHMSIDQNNETAWVFVDGSATVNHHNGKRETMPYRITAVMVKKGRSWKLRLFNGSVPEIGSG